MNQLFDIVKRNNFYLRIIFPQRLYMRGAFYNSGFLTGQFSDSPNNPLAFQEKNAHAEFVKRLREYHPLTSFF